jgi:anti-sigma factor RsiW
MTSAELACRELVEVVTDYLEGALDDADRRRFQDHLDQCADCRTYVEQLRSTLRLLGRLAPGEIDDAVLQGLLAAFADWTAGPRHRHRQRHRLENLSGRDHEHNPHLGVRPAVGLPLGRAGRP